MWNLKQLKLLKLIKQFFDCRNVEWVLCLFYLVDIYFSQFSFFQKKTFTFFISSLRNWFVDNHNVPFNVWSYSSVLSVDYHSLITVMKLNWYWVQCFKISIFGMCFFCLKVIFFPKSLYLLSGLCSFLWTSCNAATGASHKMVGIIVRSQFENSICYLSLIWCEESKLQEFDLAWKEIFCSQVTFQWLLFATKQDAAWN